MSVTVRQTDRRTKSQL